MTTQSVSEIEFDAWRRRVFAELSMTQEDIDALAEDIAATRVSGYEAELALIVTGLVLGGALRPRLRPRLTDRLVLGRLASDAHAHARSITSTFHDDLAVYLGTRTPAQIASYAALRRETRRFVQQRRVWKAEQIALTETMTAANQARIDVLTENRLVTQVQAIPRVALERRCADVIRAGWFELGSQPALPLHPNCVHRWQYRHTLREMLGDRRTAWLGGMMVKGDDDVWREVT